MLVSLEPLLFLSILLFSWGVLFCIEISGSDSILSKKIRKKLYDKTNFCFHNSATLQEKYDTHLRF